MNDNLDSIVDVVSLRGLRGARDPRETGTVRVRRETHGRHFESDKISQGLTLIFPIIDSWPWTNMATARSPWLLRMCLLRE